MWRTLRFAMAGLVSSCILVTAHIEMIKSLARAPSALEEVPLPPVSLKMLSMGYDSLLSDIYWLSFVQYVGDENARRVDHYRDSENYLRLVVGLDPHLTEAYDFAAFVVGGDEGRPDVAASILDYGILQNEDNWRIPFVAGINQYLFAHNEITAANYYVIASRRPNAPTWVARQSTILRKKIPSMLKSIDVWNAIYNSADDSHIKIKAHDELVRLWTLLIQSSSSKELKKRSLQQLDLLKSEP